jgi:hypothetical protein
LRSESVDVVIDRTPPTLTLKTPDGTILAPSTVPSLNGIILSSANVVDLEGTDYISGIASMTVAGINVGYSSTNYVSGVQTYVTVQFPDAATLPDGEYSAAVEQLAGIQSSATFIVDTTSPVIADKDGNGDALSSNTLTNDGCLVLGATDGGSGVASLNISSPSWGSSTTTFQGCPSSAKAGLYCGLAASTYTVTATDCVGNSSQTYVDVISSPAYITFYAVQS